jgi:cytochrome c5
MNKRILFIVILIAILTVILVQCAPAPTSAPALAEPTQASGAATSAPSGLDGQALVESRCTACHTLDRVKSAHKTEAQWKETVDRMISKGAQLNADEEQAVVQYLANTYK